MPLFGVEATFWALLSPFVAAALSPILAKTLKHNASWILAVIPALAFLQFLSFVPGIAEGQTFKASLEWVPTFNVNFSIYLDGLSVLFALLISGIGTLIVLYAGGYLKNHENFGQFLSFLFLFMGAMLGVVVADNIITLFVYWELTSITSFLLIGFDHLRRSSRRSAIQALVVTGGGGLALMAGLLLAGFAGGSFEMSELINSGDVLRESPYYTAIFILVLLGAFTKSAQFPFHFWLPNAMEAPTPVSAYLHSATMVKAGVYLLMRMHPVLGDTELWMTVLPIFGGLTLLVGTILGLRQTDLKLVLAYSTVASLGLLVMLTGTSDPIAIQGAVAYLFAHSLFKGSLFMVVGTVDHEAGTRDLNRVGGLFFAMPITAIAAVLSALSMAGILPLIGFVAKEVLYDGTWHIVNGGLWTAVAVLGNAMMFAMAATVAWKPFFGTKVKTPKQAHEGSILLIAGAVTLAVLGLLAGIFVASVGHQLLSPMTSAVLGIPFDEEMHLIPTYLSPALYLSMTTFALGILVFMYMDKLRALIADALRVIGWGPDKGFDQTLDLIIRFGTTLTQAIQTGSMVTYMRATFSVIALMLFIPMILTGNWPVLEGLGSLYAYEWFITAIVVIGVYAVLTARYRVTAIVLLGIQGFAVALIYLLFGAPDLSFTQFMVETLSVVILALVMTRLNLKPTDARSLRGKVFDISLSVLCGAGISMLLMSVVQLPFDATLSEFFTQYSRSVAHGRNIVNVILVDFRGFDTIGEISVVMVTGLAVLALIRVRPKSNGTSNTEKNR
ncbi:Na(+)/H(+) antiporter subunit A [Pseudovibrio axinellae]|uniref:Na(+)/H(+) antiporter subunit A n=1 Tax=Pseudovibrio axinellae TaxID=989403 RepID=A0A166AE16_9HYPH|nr:putative monovalent cation/H+ antiporter subunit A [Pseudovibrio axinellae]KZL20950.1 Na(+)/H(+) antiporter subunit A [Pseudovibrio axinellae]SEP81692.1 multisubunit sodium/proton antiporter, MrpA subunit [Pseudovibrio axinellae]